MTDKHAAPEEMVYPWQTCNWDGSLELGVFANFHVMPAKEALAARATSTLTQGLATSVVGQFVERLYCTCVVVHAPLVRLQMACSSAHRGNGLLESDRTCSSIPAAFLSAGDASNERSVQGSEGLFGGRNQVGSWSASSNGGKIVLKNNSANLYLTREGGFVFFPAQPSAPALVLDQGYVPQDRPLSIQVPRFWTARGELVRLAARSFRQPSSDWFNFCVVAYLLAHACLALGQVGTPRAASHCQIIAQHCRLDGGPTLGLTSKEAIWPEQRKW